MSRITLTDTLMSSLMTMAEGNPGAITAMMELVEKHADIDPQSVLGGIGIILSLDTAEIYGSDIYVLFSDKCGRDARKMIMLMRSVQLGFLSNTKLQQMAADQMREINLTDDEWADLDSKVCEQLEDFQKAA